MSDDDKPAVVDEALLDTPEVVEPHKVDVLFVDWIVAVGNLDAVVNIDLGAMDYSLRTDRSIRPRVIMQSHLRLRRESALTLYKSLGATLGIASPDEQPAPPQGIPSRHH